MPSALRGRSAEQVQKFLHETGLFDPSNDALSMAVLCGKYDKARQLLSERKKTLDREERARERELKREEKRDRAQALRDGMGGDWVDHKWAMMDRSSRDTHSHVCEILPEEDCPDADAIAKEAEFLLKSRLNDPVALRKRLDQFVAGLRVDLLPPSLNHLRWRISAKASGDLRRRAGKMEAAGFLRALYHLPIDHLETLRSSLSEKQFFDQVHSEFPETRVRQGFLSDERTGELARSMGLRVRRCAADGAKIMKLLREHGVLIAGVSWYEEDVSNRKPGPGLHSDRREEKWFVHEISGQKGDRRITTSLPGQTRRTVYTETEFALLEPEISAVEAAGTETAPALRKWCEGCSAWRRVRRKKSGVWYMLKLRVPRESGYVIPGDAEFSALLKSMGIPKSEREFRPARRSGTGRVGPWDGKCRIAGRAGTGIVHFHSPGDCMMYFLVDKRNDFEFFIERMESHPHTLSVLFRCGGDTKSALDLLHGLIETKFPPAESFGQVPDAARGEPGSVFDSIQSFRNHAGRWLPKTE